LLQNTGLAGFPAKATENRAAGAHLADSIGTA
jgi:hypothetical protein